MTPNQSMENELLGEVDAHQNPKPIISVVAIGVCMSKIEVSKYVTSVPG